MNVSDAELELEHDDEHQVVLAAPWWAWSVFAWLTSAMDVDEGGVRLAMLRLDGSAVCSLVVAYEAIRYRADSVRVRHPEVAA